MKIETLKAQVEAASLACGLQLEVRCYNGYYELAAALPGGGVRTIGRPGTKLEVYKQAAAIEAANLASAAFRRMK